MPGSSPGMTIEEMARVQPTQVDARIESHATRRTALSRSITRPASAAGHGLPK
jgi:hypothetical protein